MQAGIRYAALSQQCLGILDQKMEIWGIIFCHIFTIEPGKPMFSETLNTVSTFIFIKFFIKCMKEGQKVRFSATENSTYSQYFQ